jgi:hypothetical protein
LVVDGERRANGREQEPRTATCGVSATLEMRDAADTLVTAYHESSHACIARVLGHEVTVVTLDSTKVRYRDKGPSSRWNEAVIALSDPIAEIRHGAYSADEIERKRISCSSCARTGSPIESSNRSQRIYSD